MKKFYSMLLFLSLFGVTLNMEAQNNEQFIKLTTTKGIGSTLKLDLLIYDGLDAEGEVKDVNPEEGTNITFEGAKVHLIAGMKVFLTLEAQEVKLKGNIDYLSIVNQEVTDIDVSRATHLYELRVNENPLTSIDLSQNKELGQFWASSCRNLTNVNLGDGEKLNSLSLQGTQVASLDLAGKTTITNLNLGDNPRLTTYDFSTLSKLDELWINGNEIATIDVSNNPLLRHFECSKNRISSLDVTANTGLEFFSLWGNQIKEREMDKLIGSLVKETEEVEREFCVYNQYYAGTHNHLSVTQAQAVKARGWKPKEAEGSIDFFMWKPYEGTTETGITTINSLDSVKDKWFDLNGRSIDRPTQKGIYIKNRKKVVIG